jgi:hypothetical protein
MGKFFALVSERGSEELTADDAVVHSAVLTASLDNHTVIPVRFGTTADHPDDVARLVEDNRHILDRLAKRLRGRMETGVKVFWGKEALKEAVSAYVNLEQVKADSAVRPKESYAKAVEVGQTAERIIADWRGTVLAGLRDTLAPLADDSAEGRLVSIYMLCNVSFLVRARKAEMFKRHVFRLEEQWGETFRIHYVDRLPPFSFSTFAMGRSEEDGRG